MAQTISEKYNTNILIGSPEYNRLQLDLINDINNLTLKEANTLLSECRYELFYNKFKLTTQETEARIAVVRYIDLIFTIPLIESTHVRANNYNLHKEALITPFKRHVLTKHAKPRCII